MAAPSSSSDDDVASLVPEDVFSDYGYYSNDTDHCFVLYDYDVRLLLRNYYIPFLIVFGVIGNVISCVVFLATNLKLRSSSYYLAALAVADILFLVALFVVTFWNSFFNTDGWCQLFVYVSQVSSSLSTWLIVAFTVERFIAIQYPLRRPQICTVSKAKSVVCGLTVAALFTHGYVFWTSAVLQGAYGYPECEMDPEYHDLMTVVNYFDTVFSFILPFVLIVLMNTMIARNIFKFSKRIRTGALIAQRMAEAGNRGESESSGRHSTSVVNSQKSNTPRSAAEMLRDQEHVPSIHLKSGNVMSTKIQQSISKMLLLVSTVFICLNLPSYATRAYTFFIGGILQEDPSRTLWCVQQFCMMIFYTNYSINFMLYSMYGVTFRRCLWQLISNTATNVKNCFK